MKVFGKPPFTPLYVVHVGNPIEKSFSFNDRDEAYNLKGNYLAHGYTAIVVETAQ